MIFSHVVIRAWGLGFIVMLALISTFERETGIERTNWFTAFITVGLVFLGFIFANSILKAARSAGLSDHLIYVSYPAGIIFSVLIFSSPMRP